MILEQFTLKKRDFVHFGDGWCCREVNVGSKVHYRLFWGVSKGGKPPEYLTAQKDELDDFIDFDSLEEAIDWFLKRSAGRV